jgi:hypothetical protein
MARHALLSLRSLRSGLTVASRFRLEAAPRALLALLVGVAGCAEPPAVTGRIVDEELDSEVVGDTYRILVRLPPGYDDSSAARYPAIFQLDATSFGPQFEITAGHASELAASGAIPEAIVVGVGYPYDDEVPNDERGRWRDYVTARFDGSEGGAASFLRFLAEELIPHVDERYRTDPDRARALFGHSLGGFFVLYTLLRTADEASPPFGAFVAADPSLGHDDNRLLFLEQELAGRTGSLPAALRLTIARYNGAVQQLLFETLSSRLDRDFPDIGLEAEMIETDHGGAIAPSYREGLRFVLGEGGVR